MLSIRSLLFCIGIFSHVAITAAEHQLTLPKFEQWYHSQEQEQALTLELRDSFLKLQELIAERSPEQKKQRGTHAKGHCITGTFQVLADDELSSAAFARKADLRHGLFAPAYIDEVLPARYRFANSSGRVLPDFIPDIRALSIAVQTHERLSQHFAFNNAPHFELKDLQTFVDVLKMGILVAEGSYKLTAFAKLAWHAGLRRAFAAKAAVDMGEEDKAIADSFSNQSYRSGSTFALGGQPVKLGAYPCDLQVQHTDDLVNKTITADEAKQRGADYLGTQLVSELQSGGICHKLFVQFLDETDQYHHGFDKELIEDTTRIWTGPIHTVAELQIAGEQLSPATCDDPVNGLNPAKVHIDLPGLGQINRARSLIESASRAAR